MELSKSERLIILMLCDIMRKQSNPKHVSGFDPDYIDLAVGEGHLWALDSQYGEVLGDKSDTNEQVTTVIDILEMWECLERSYASLNESDQKVVLESCEKEPAFLGFDGNNETWALSIAYFLINHQDRFVHFAKKNLNSHWPFMANYRKMAEIFQLMRPNLHRGQMSAEQIIEIMKVGYNNEPHSVIF